MEQTEVKVLKKTAWALSQVGPVANLNEGDIVVMSKNSAALIVKSGYAEYVDSSKNSKQEAEKKIAKQELETKIVDTSEAEDKAEVVEEAPKKRGRKKKDSE